MDFEQPRREKEGEDKIKKMKKKRKKKSLLGFVGAPWSPVCMGDASSSGLFPHPHRVRVPEGCFSLVTLFERKSVGTFLS